jgi:hypothetical protein
MTLGANGNLLVGTTTDNGARLQVEGSATFTKSGQVALITQSAAILSNGVYALDVDNSAQGSNMTTAGAFRINTGGNTAAFVVNGLGNVGIGTASPVNLLQVSRNATSDAAIVVSNLGTASSTTTMSFVLQENDVPNGWFRRYRDGSAITEIGFSNDFVIAGNIQSSKSERMRITSGGNLLIGTTTDAGYKLLVNGTTYTVGFSPNATAYQGNVTMNTGTTYVYNASSGSHTFTLQSASGTNQIFIVKNHSARSLTIATTGGDVIIDNAGASTTTFTLAANKAMIIQQDGGSTNYIISIY